MLISLLGDASMICRAKHILVAAGYRKKEIPCNYITKKGFAAAKILFAIDRYSEGNARKYLFNCVWFEYTLYEIKYLSGRGTWFEHPL